MSDHFFTVKHALPINIIPLAMDYKVPSVEKLNEELPEVFRVANAVTEVDSQVHSQMSHVNHDDAKVLVAILAQQSRKIEIILNYILSSLDESKYREKTSSFGGDKLTYISKTLLKTNQPVRLKVFLPEEYTAIYCYGRVKKRAKAKNGFQILVEFESIREIDQELMVRASLHVQSKLLKKRAERKQHDT